MQIVWEFIVREESVEEFQAAYGPQGSWVKLFERAEGFLGTVLLRSDQAQNKFLTIDRWKDVASYKNFRQIFAAEYAELDAQLDKLTISETRIGAFEELD
ncbi:antibiotic biosynthesis monooxygenase family protein [Granulicella aggregans]|jgi:heme-degrading monooxygenase HmoA|uniref:antibiotic biosynthesis monooxygenase family protein n=1 Tax=Granulicella aggregans TaxID=474949 RepID=UPI0021E053B5|nr:antibiotic biosynthesis monooxygenase [Granulicella aggregans]